MRNSLKEEESIYLDAKENGWHSAPIRKLNKSYRVRVYHELQGTQFMSSGLGSGLGQFHHLPTSGTEQIV